MKKKIIMSLIIVVIFILLFIIIKFNLFTIMFAEKNYITFENLDKVKIAYKSDGWSSSTTTNIEKCEVDIEDKDFLKLLEDTYQNKIFNNYKTSLLAKGEYKIVINDNIELCTSHNEDYFCLDYNGKWLNIKANKEIYNKMIEIIKTELENIKNTKISNITMEILEGTISATNAKIVITDNNEKTYGWGENYKIQKKIKDIWEDITPINQPVFSNSAYKLNSENQIKLNIDWSNIYGELSTGTYRIVKPVYVDYEENIEWTSSDTAKITLNGNEIMEVYSNEFEIK